MKQVLRIPLFALGCFLIVGGLWSALKPLGIALGMLAGTPMRDADWIILRADIEFTLIVLLLGMLATWGAAKMRPKARPDDFT